MIGLALIVPLSLLLMWRRVRRRGGFGRKASAVLRSVYPLVLGLGGWFIGLIIVLIAFPSVRARRRDRSRPSRSACRSASVPTWPGSTVACRRRAGLIGFAGAVAAALVGAWLGFHATTGLLAVITTIVGAAVAANLTLIFLDIARDRAVAEHADSSQPALTTAEALIPTAGAAAALAPPRPASAAAVSRQNQTGMGLRADCRV